MENTDRINFGDDKPKWYLALGETWIGPLTSAEVHRRITAGELSWANYFWKEGDGNWTRICDSDFFRDIAPSPPPSELLSKLKEAIKPTIRKAGLPRRRFEPPVVQTPAEQPLQDENKWFLYFNDSQYGPFSTEEIHRYLKAGRLHKRVHAWMDGMKDWLRLENIDEFKNDDQSSQLVLPPQVVQEERKESRTSPRKPLVARIIMTDESSVFAGMCRDVSVGGMQVLSDKIPGEVGTKLKLNVSPSGDTPIKPFVARGAIVRILEDGQGFSFRFEQLEEDAKNAIEQYVT